jgi:hypothetical protein
VITALHSRGRGGKVNGSLGRRYEAKKGEKRCKEEGKMSGRGLRE